MKYLKLFTNTIDFENYKNSNDFIVPNVSYESSSKKVFYHSETKNKSSMKPGDVAYWDGTTIKLVDINNWNNELGVPVGVVVIPSGVLPDGKARIAGLETQNLNWGPTKTIALSKQHSVVPVFDNVNYANISGAEVGYLPSGYFYGDPCIDDKNICYYSYSEESIFIPTPIVGNINDLKLNINCVKDLEGNNAIADFYGANNTNAICKLIDNYPAAQYCYNYSDGVSNLKWYLPSMGELACAMAKVVEINDALSYFGNVFSAGSPFLSSTEISEDKIYCIQIEYGSVYANEKNRYGFVKPFAILE